MMKTLAMTLVAATLTLNGAMAQVPEVDVLDRAAKIAERDGTLDSFRAQTSVGAIRQANDRITSLTIACTELLKVGRAALVAAKTTEQRDALVPVLNSIYAIRGGSGLSISWAVLEQHLNDSRRVLLHTGCKWTGSHFRFGIGDGLSTHRLDEHLRWCPSEVAAKRLAVAHSQTADGYRRLFGRADLSAAEVLALTRAVAAGSGNYGRSLASQLIAAVTAVR